MKVELRQIAKLFANAIAAYDEREYSEIVEEMLEELRKLNQSGKVALRNAYIWSRKVPAPEREDMLQELFLTLWEKKAQQDKLAYSIARCDWQDFWRRYKIRSHYSLDWEIENEDGVNERYGDLLIGEVDFERRVDGELDSQKLWEHLPEKIQGFINKRFQGKSLTASERVQLNRFVKRNYSLLADYS